MNNGHLENSIRIVTEFLEENPGEASEGCETKEKQIENIENAYAKKIEQNERTTKPDYLVSEVLELHFGHDKNKRELIQKQYNDQKQAEMMIGELLEIYIYEEGRVSGWVFTAECIKAVDFIKKEKSDWILLQVKNSDNTENSSAKAIRDGTPILKWHRRNSKPRLIKAVRKKDGKLSKQGWGELRNSDEFKKRFESNDFSDYQTPEFNWEKFPDGELKGKLSEKRFRDFVSKYFQTE